MPIVSPVLGPQDERRSRSLKSYHIVIRRYGLEWRWRVMDYDQMIEEGVTSKRMEAQAAAHKARLAYAERVNPYRQEQE